MLNHNSFCVQVPQTVIMDPDQPTLNKRLTGQANPRTLVQPTIVPPSHDITVWKQNPSYRHSQINERTPLNVSLAGFNVPMDVQTCPPPESSLQISDPNLVPIQPSIYTATDVFQPINANLGIAETPQFPNTTLYQNVDGNQIFFETNQWVVQEQPFQRLDVVAPPGAPGITDGISEAPSIGAEPPVLGPLYDPANVYDPRFTGYGADDRYYLDPLLGAPRYNYGDINAIRMPSYLGRNKIDTCVTSCTDYGNVPMGFTSLDEARQCAEKRWLENSLEFRTDLSRRLMRKKEEEMVQKRMAPKRTF